MLRRIGGKLARPGAVSVGSRCFPDFWPDSLPVRYSIRTGHRISSFLEVVSNSVGMEMSWLFRPD